MPSMPSLTVEPQDAPSTGRVGAAVRTEPIMIAGILPIARATCEQALATSARATVSEASLARPLRIVQHLSHPTGGVRAFGNWRRTWKPHFAIGIYYSHLCGTGLDASMWWIALRHLVSRHNLFSPWWIPAMLMSHLRAFWWARKQQRRGRKLLGAQYRQPAARFANSGLPTGVLKEKENELSASHQDLPPKGSSILAPGKGVRQGILA
jgi:hypothetical protein